MDVMQSEIQTANEMILARNVGDVLEKKYPGWLWFVYVQDGVVMIRSLRLSGRYGFMIKEEEIDNDYRAIMRAGGEMLERYNQDRAAFNYDKWRQVPMLVTGDLKGDVR